MGDAGADFLDDPDPCMSKDAAVRDGVFAWSVMNESFHGMVGGGAHTAEAYFLKPLCPNPRNEAKYLVGSNYAIG